jgi:Domain of unknown function (DUF4118)
MQFPERHPWWLRYGSSIPAALIASGLSALLVYNHMRLHSSFMLTAVVVTAWFGGMGPGLLTLALSLPAEIWLRDPVNTWIINTPQNLAGILEFALNSLVICALFRKRYFQRSRTEISPVAVTGGWMWRFDPADGGTVETNSPELPSLSATRTLAMWLENVQPEDRAALEQQIQQAMITGQLTAKYHAIHHSGEIRLVSMIGVKMRDKSTGEDSLVATCIEVGMRDNPETMKWSAVSLP